MKSTPTPEWMRNPPRTPVEQVRLLKQYRNLLRSPGRKGKFLRNILQQLNSKFQQALTKAKQLQPLAVFKPSFEQALLLNAWVYGIGFIGVYCANRIGKTTAMILNWILWAYPNDPKWKIFHKYIVGDPKDDPLNSDNPNRGMEVHVLQRPHISALEKVYQARERYLTHCTPSPTPPDPSKNFEYPPNARYLQWLQKQVPEAFESVWPDHPWDTGGEVWMGAPDLKHHRKKIMPIWKRYLPAASVERWVPSEQEMTVKIPSGKGAAAPTFTMWEISGLSYDQDDTKWSSGAVDAILLTEGVTLTIWKEVKARFKDPGIGSHDFTPYEPANVGAATALAKKILTGKEQPPLPTHVFTGFDVYSAPRQVMSDRKKKGLIKGYENDPEGEARLKGLFYTSSLLILSKYDPAINLLPYSPSEMFKLWPNGRIYRGLDPGLDHPTACAWVYILPSNVKIVYRILSKQGLTIPERAAHIVRMSGNSLRKKFWGPGPRDFYLIECNDKKESEIVCATAADYHIFKTDEETNSSYVQKYQIAGLNVVESTHIDQEERAVSLNSDLQSSEFIPHPVHGRPPSPKVFFLQYGEGIMETLNKWDEFYWDRIKTGDNKGMPKDKVPDHGDDELDAVCYVTAGNFVWTNWRPSAIFSDSSEPDAELMEASMKMNKNKDFAMIAKPTAQETVFFGSRTLEEDIPFQRY